MATKGSIKSPVEPESNETVAEERAEQREMARTGRSEKAMEAAEARKMKGGRKMMGKR